VTISRADDEVQLRPCRELLQQGKVIEAISCFRDEAQREKKGAASHIGLGEALLQADSTNEAIAVLVQARELDTANAKIFELLGDAYLKQSIPAAAVQQFEKATQMDSMSISAFIKLARTDMKLKQYNPAAAAYRRAIALDTNNVDVYRELGTLYFKANQYENAIPLLLGLINRDSAAVKERSQLVKAYFQTKRFDDVIPLGQQILAKDSTDTDVIRYLATSYMRTKDNANAELLFAALQRRDSMKADDYVEYAKALKGLDRTVEAITAYEKAVAADSALCEVFYDFGTLYMKNKSYADAVRLFDMRYECDTSIGYRFACKLNAGLCLMQLKDYTRARAYILISIDLRPDYIQGWNALASCYAQMDSASGQRAAYEKVIELISALPESDRAKYATQYEEAYRMIGVQLLLDKKFEPSIKYLKEALKLNPKDCSLLLWIAQANHNSNNKEEAKKYYCKVLELCPKAKEAKDAQKGLDFLGFSCDE
jgi:tetratricopeptide (TPR) repeat protein